MLKPVSNRELEEALGSIVEILQKKRADQGEGEDKKSAFWERYLLQENYSQSLLEKGYKEGICSPEGKYFLEIRRIFPDSDTKKKKNLVLYHFIIQNVAAEFMEDRHQKLMAVLRESDYEWVLVAEEKEMCIRDRFTTRERTVPRAVYKMVFLYPTQSWEYSPSFK